MKEKKKRLPLNTDAGGGWENVFLCNLKARKLPKRKGMSTEKKSVLTKETKGGVDRQGKQDTQEKGGGSSRLKKEMKVLSEKKKKGGMVGWALAIKRG